VIALDSSILVHAHREDSTHHAAARSVVEGLAALRTRNPLIT
jgi:predicted nucleic acid-binding protein